MVKPAGIFSRHLWVSAFLFWARKKVEMKKYLDKCFSLAVLLAIGLIIYKLTQQGLMGAITQELKRYSGVNVRHLYLVGLLVMASFPIGWVLSKTRLHNKSL